MVGPAVEAMRVDPSVIGDMLADDLPPADVAFLDDADASGAFLAMTAAGVADGAAGWIDDDLAFVAPWGFDPKTITVPTLVWAGEADTLVPVAHAHWLHAAISGSTLVTVPGGGHLGAFPVQERVLGWLLSGEAV